MKVSSLEAVLVVALFAGCARHHATVPPEDFSAYHKSPYDNPLSTPGARFGSLPAVVQNTVRSEAGTEEIIDARREIMDGHLFYKISFRDEKNFPPLLVGPDGSVLNSDLTVAVPAPQEASQSIKLTELPPAVKKVLDERQPGVEVASVNHENWGSHSVYIISFKDEVQHQKLYVVGDGKVLIPVK